jgi:hypothetical protein
MLTPPLFLRCSINARKASKAFKGAKRGLVVVAAAEPETPAPAAPRARKPQRTITVPTADLKQGMVVDGTVVSAGRHWQRKSCVGCGHGSDQPAAATHTPPPTPHPADLRGVLWRLCEHWR